MCTMYIGGEASKRKITDYGCGLCIDSDTIRVEGTCIKYLTIERRCSLTLTA